MAYEGTAVDFLTGEVRATTMTPEQIAAAQAGAAEEAALAVLAAAEETKAKLREIDIASIRALREYVAAQPDAPKLVKDKEAEAAVERGKMK